MSSEKEKNEKRKQFVSDALESIIEVSRIISDIDTQLDASISAAEKKDKNFDPRQAERVAKELSERLRKEYGDKVLKKYRDEYFTKKEE